jgi:hypothetical protein
MIHCFWGAVIGFAGIACRRATTCVTAHSIWVAVASALALSLYAAPLEASPSCKPRRPKPIIVLKSMGPCAFDPDALSFVGEPQQQAMCLLRAFDRSRNLAPTLTSLPPVLAERVGSSSGLPSRGVLNALLVKLDLGRDFAAGLWRPVSHARDNDPEAPAARYFVIHDTSGPNFSGRSFPVNIDVSPKINNLRLFFCPDGWGRSHVVINRSGRMIVDHDFEIPWRETKFERAPRFAGALKGLFLHIELIQPRRRAPGRGRRNDAQAPTPGFTAAQYDGLALLYVIASVRADTWLVPAFHAPIDADIRGGHDDPQNFELQALATSLRELLKKLQAEELQVSFTP